MLCLNIYLNIYIYTYNVYTYIFIHTYIYRPLDTTKLCIDSNHIKYRISWALKNFKSTYKISFCHEISKMKIYRCTQPMIRVPTLPSQWPQTLRQRFFNFQLEDAQGLLVGPACFLGQCSVLDPSAITCSILRRIVLISLYLSGFRALGIY